MRYLWLASLAGFVLLSQVTPARAQGPARTPILLDTSIGTNIDDAFALALALTSPEIELRGVTTLSGDTKDRAWMVCRLLSLAGRKEIPVAAGDDPQPKQEIDWQIQYRR